jgi:uracil-DNA glycosylase
LISQIETLKPKLVITVGTIARDVFIEENKLQIIMGETVRIDGYHYLPLYHPSPANPVGHRKNIEIITNNRKQLLSIIK